MAEPFYLLTGEEFLAGEALDKIRAEVDADPLSEIEVDASEPAQHIIEALETASLLGGIRVVVVTTAQELRKEHLEALERYLASPSETSVLVAIAAGRNAKLADLAKRTGTTVSLEAPKGRRLASWIKQRGKDHELRIDDRAAWALIDSVGNELRDLDGALGQLATQLGTGAQVGAGEVRAAFARLADERIYAFTDAVGERKLPRAMELLRRLYDQGEDPLPLLGALTNHIRRLLRARRHADRGSAAVGDVLGMLGWRAERMATQARSYSEDELVDAMGFLAEADFEMKGGDLPPQAALERAVVKIVER